MKLCWLGLHKFTEWETVKDREFFTFNYNYRGEKYKTSVFTVQKRVCKHCKMEKMRREFA